MKLNKGQMSAPVHSSFGWHLIQLMDTRNVDKTDAAQKDRAYRMLFNRKFSEEAATLDAGTTRQRLRESVEQLMKPHRVVITPGEPAGIGPDPVEPARPAQLAGRVGCLCRCNTVTRPGSFARSAFNAPPLR